MTFAALIVKNLFRQRMRTTLTAVGIAVGIATVVALGVTTSGLRAASAEFVRSGGADFMVAQKGASDLSFSAVPERDWRTIEARPDVERATGVLFEVAHVGSNPFFLYFGYEPQALRRLGIRPVVGRLLASEGGREALLGTKAASAVGVSVGQTIVLDGTSFRIVGLYRTGDLWQDSGAIVPLATAQRLSSKKNVVTAVHVVTARGDDPRELADALERDFPRLVAIESAADYGKVDQGFRILDAVNLAVSLLAVGIGAIGVMNTMIMSVFERTREIGVLRAVGWRGSRIVRMILLESAALCVVGAVVGVLLGILAARAILLVPAVSTFLTPAYTAQVFVRALVVGLVVAFAGALYPAIRAVRLSPMEALRYE